MTPERLEASKKYREANREKIRVISKNCKLKTFKSNWAGRTLSTLKSRAKEKGLDFNLEKEDLILPEFCPILGIVIEFSKKRDNGPSVDRIDNSKGYVKGNIHTISGRANRLKSDASVEELTKLSNYFTGLGDDK